MQISIALEDDLQVSTMEDRKRIWATLALIVGMVSIGFSAIFVRGADAPGTVTVFYRMMIGSLIMAFPFLGQARKLNSSLHRRAVWMAVLGGIFFGFDIALWATGIVISGATIPTLMGNTAPLWVGLGALIIFRERQSTQFWVGLLVAMLGAGVVLGQDFSISAEFGLGALLGLLAGVFYGAYYLISQRARSHLATIPYFWITTSTTALLLLVVNLILRRPFTGYSGFTYLIFLAVGVFVQVIGWLTINYAQGYLPASIVAPTLLGQPVLTAIIAWPLFGEKFTLWHLVGGMAVITGVYLVHRSRQE
jgi:drug/metabolite transporter (DMT)-like permease